MSESSTEPRVLVISGTGVDSIVRVQSLPFEIAETMHVEPILDYVGHSGNGVSTGLHMLEVPTVFVDVIGDDTQGAFIRRQYEEIGLDFQFVIHPSGTRRSVNFVAGDGRRMSFHDARHPYDYVPDNSLWRDHFEWASHVHLTIINWARHALSDAIYQGKSTSTDLHDWDGVNPHHRDFAYGTKLVFLSASNIGDREHAVVEDIRRHGRAEVIVVMDGEKGSRLYPKDGERLEMPAVSLLGRPVIDTNGAGDAYVAAFLDVYLRDRDLEKAAQAGTLAGAWACTSAGTHTRLITRAEMDEMDTVRMG